MDISGKRIAGVLLSIDAIKLRPDDPFTWASGYRMPIYNDNRMLLGAHGHRNLIDVSLGVMIQREEINFDVIAGTSTAGIPWATLVADDFEKPMIYVRDKPKGHGLRNQIEGIDAEKDLEDKRVVLVEDLISTGGSSARAVQAIRDANGEIDYCLSIFNYGLYKAADMFTGRTSIDDQGTRLDPPCEVRSLLTYDVLLDVAKKTGYITEEQAEVLAEWRADPFGWGEVRGFPRVEKK